MVPPWDVTTTRCPGCHSTSCSSARPARCITSMVLSPPPCQALEWSPSTHTAPPPQLGQSSFMRWEDGSVQNALVSFANSFGQELTLENSSWLLCLRWATRCDSLH